MDGSVLHHETVYCLQNADFCCIWSLIKSEKVIIARFLAALTFRLILRKVLWQAFFCTINRNSKNIADITRFSIDNPRFSIEKLGISIENLGFSAILKVFQPTFQDFQILVDDPKFSIDISRFLTDHPRF